MAQNYEKYAREMLANGRPDNVANIRKAAIDGPLGRALRSRAGQERAMAILQEFPGLAKLYARPGMSPGEVVLRAAQSIGDPAQTAANARAFGLPNPGKVEHRDLVDLVARGVGYREGVDFSREWLEPVATATMQENLEITTYIRDEERERARGWTDSVPPVDAHTKAQAQDNEDRRARLAFEFERAEARKPSFEQAKASLYYPSNDRQADIARSWAALEGKVNPVAGNSPGARAQDERPEVEREENSIRLEGIRSDVRSEVSREWEFENSLEPTVDDASPVVYQGGEG